jgi:putative sterol carrier protein
MLEINNSQKYAEAARNWEGDFYFVVEADAGLKEKMILYMDLLHGKCREAFAVKSETAKTPEFVISAGLGKWRKVIEKKLDPIQGLITRQLVVKGNLIKIMKVPRAALELVNCCALVPTVFPEG